MNTDFTDNGTQTLVANHLAAAKALLQAGLEEMKRTAHDEYQAVALAAQQGAFFQVRTALSTAGLVEVNVELLTQEGDEHQLMHVEMDAGPMRH